MKRLIAATKAKLARLRIFYRLLHLETAIHEALVLCPGCGGVFMSGHPQLKQLDAGGGQVAQVCKRCEPKLRATKTQRAVIKKQQKQASNVIRYRKAGHNGVDHGPVGA